MKMYSVTTAFPTQPLKIPCLIISMSYILLTNFPMVLKLHRPVAFQLSRPQVDHGSGRINVTLPIRSIQISNCPHSGMSRICFRRRSNENSALSTQFSEQASFQFVRILGCERKLIIFGVLMVFSVSSFPSEVLVSAYCDRILLTDVSNFLYSMP